MKREAMGNTKLKRLSRTLGLRSWGAVGILESLWHLTAREAPQGDIGKLSNDDISLGVDWDGDAAALVNALVDARWLDRCPVHRLIVHDWHEHADDAVKKKLQRSGKAFAVVQVTTVSEHVETCIDTVGTCSPTRASARASASASASEERDAHAEPSRDTPSPEPVNLNPIALEIACAHPAAVMRNLHPGEIPVEDIVAIVTAIRAEARQQQVSTEVAAGALLQFTRGYGAAVAQWPPGDHRFVMSISKFFESFEYRKNPETWRRNGTHRQANRSGSARTAAQQRHHDGLSAIAAAFPELAGLVGDGPSDGRDEGELRQPVSAAGMGRANPVTLDGDRGTVWHSRAS